MSSKPEVFIIESLKLDDEKKKFFEGKILADMSNLSDKIGSDIDQTFQEPVSLEDFLAIKPDGTGVKQQKGRKGQLRAVIGITQAGRVEPLGSFTNTEWPEIERNIKERNELPRSKLRGIKMENTLFEPPHPIPLPLKGGEGISW